METPIQITCSFIYNLIVNHTDCKHKTKCVRYLIYTVLFWFLTSIQIVQAQTPSVTPGIPIQFSAEILYYTNNDSQTTTQTTSCPNSNFSQGTFANWQGYYGIFSNPGQNIGFVTLPPNERHLIISAPGTIDPYGTTSAGTATLTTVFPGESYSARLGNPAAGAQAERLTYNITIGPQNNLFIYRYAAVLNDAGHPPNQQPSFEMNIIDQATGQQFDPLCGYFYVSAQPGLPGWYMSAQVANGAPVYWNNWTTVGLAFNMSDYGKNLTIIFTTKDCQSAGHFGYAYISAFCSAVSVSTQGCDGSGQVILAAPSGFATYKWTGPICGTCSPTVVYGQTLAITNAHTGDNYSLDLTSLNGCQVNQIMTTISLPAVNANFIPMINCNGYSGFFTDLSASTIQSQPITNRTWDFGDGSTTSTTSISVQHTYAISGTYTVTLTATTQNGCSGTATQTVIIDPYLNKPVANFTNSSGPIPDNCLYNPVSFDGSSSLPKPPYNPENISILYYEWNFGDPGSGSNNLVNSGANPLVTHIFSSSGTYTVILTVTNSKYCTDTYTQAVIIDNSLPSASFSNTIVCLGETTHFTSASFTPIGNIIQLEWQFGDGSLTVSYNPIEIISHAYPAPGTYIASLRVTNSNNCISGYFTKEVLVTPALFPVSILIAPSANPVCLGNSVTLNAFPNNGGSSPDYQWKVNGLDTGPNFPVFTYAPANNDVVTCVMTSDATCISGNPATSNTITMEVHPPPIILGSDSVYLNSTDNIYSTQSGMTLYDWMVSSGGLITSGAGTATIVVTWNIPGNQEVAVNYTYSDGCAASAPTFLPVMVIPPQVPVQYAVTNVTVGSGQIPCYNATQTIIVAGNGTVFNVQSGGNATMIAGQNIKYLPTTIVQSGGYLWGYIAPTGPWCSTLSMPAYAMGEDEIPGSMQQSFFKVYPNPTNGSFILELTGEPSVESVTVDIYGIWGRKVMSAGINGEIKHAFSLSDRPAGIYFIRVISGEKAETIKIIKQ